MADRARDRRDPRGTGRRRRDRRSADRAVTALFRREASSPRLKLAAAAATRVDAWTQAVEYSAAARCAAASPKARRWHRGRRARQFPAPSPGSGALARISAGRSSAGPATAGTAAVSRPRRRARSTGWDDLLDEARDGIVAFAGGELRISADAGDDPHRRRRLSGARRARALRGAGRPHGPSVGSISAVRSASICRRSAARPHGRRPRQRSIRICRCHSKRTAVNGFGFVQIVRPRPRASLLELAQDRGVVRSAGVAPARWLGRPGAKRLVAHSGGDCRYRDAARLARAAFAAGRRGDRLAGGRRLPMSGGYAETA